MARLFKLDMDNNLFFEVCKLASSLGISPAAFVEHSIRNCIKNKDYEQFKKTTNN